MCQVNFIEEFNSFIQFAKDNVLSAQERSFWMALFYVCNGWAMRHYNPQTKTADWPDDFIVVTNEEIYLLSNLNKKAILTVRNRLKQRGLIDFKQGIGNTGAKPMYKLRYLSLEVGGKNAPNYAPNYGPNYGPNYAPNYGPNSFPTMAPTPAQDSYYININNNINKDVNQNVPTHTNHIDGNEGVRVREGYMGLDNQLRPARYDNAFMFSARARGAIAHRLLVSFDGDVVDGDTHAMLCEMMENGMPPELIEDTMETVSNTAELERQRRHLYRSLGYDKEPDRRLLERCRMVMNGNESAAQSLFRMEKSYQEAKNEY